MCRILPAVGLTGPLTDRWADGRAQADLVATKQPDMQYHGVSLSLNSQNCPCVFTDCSSPGLAYSTESKTWFKGATIRNADSHQQFEKVWDHHNVTRNSICDRRTSVRHYSQRASNVHVRAWHRFYSGCYSMFYACKACGAGRW